MYKKNNYKNKFMNLQPGFYAGHFKENINITS